jgi:hypothetical protein
VQFVGIIVGGARVAESDLDHDLSTGRGGVIVVDSGTSVNSPTPRSSTRFAARRRGSGSPPRSGFSLFNMCYNLSGARW